MTALEKRMRFIVRKVSVLNRDRAAFDAIAQDSLDGRRHQRARLACANHPDLSEACELLERPMCRRTASAGSEAFKAAAKMSSACSRSFISQEDSA